MRFFDVIVIGGGVTGCAIARALSRYELSALVLERGEDVCTIDLDEDEYLDYLTRNTSSCPYYKYYDEYKSVQKQN